MGHSGNKLWLINANKEETRMNYELYQRVIITLVDRPSPVLGIITSVDPEGLWVVIVPAKGAIKAEVIYISLPQDEWATILEVIS